MSKQGIPLVLTFVNSQNDLYLLQELELPRIAAIAHGAREMTCCQISSSSSLSAIAPCQGWAHNSSCAMRF